MKMNDNYIIFNDAPSYDNAAGNEALRKALAERDRFLERQPHLRPWQEEIDRILDKSGDHQGRMAVLGTLIQGKLLDMQKELFELSDILRKTLDAHAMESRGNRLS